MMERRAISMTDQPRHAITGQSSRRFGMAAVVIACLACVSQSLVVVIGPLAFVILFALALSAAVCGLAAVAVGIGERDWLGCSSGALGLSLVGWLVWSFVGNVTHF
jgi:hypothetical protein